MKIFFSTASLTLISLLLPLAANSEDMKYKSLIPPARQAEKQLPRKVLVATVEHHFRHAPLESRLADITSLIDKSATQAHKKYPGKRLDIIVLPESALQLVSRVHAEQRAMPITHEAVKTIAAKARQYDTYIALAMSLKEGKKNYNSVVLLDRKGEVAGIYRKVHTVINWEAENPKTTERGMSPGKDFPVFNCDFGKLGVLICFDTAYADGWTVLGKRGAEIVVIPTASPQTFRPAMFAYLNRYYVVTSAWRDNSTIFDPLGQVVAQITKPGVLVHEIDLSYSILNWSPSLTDGKVFTQKYGDKVGFQYSSREDCGLFWSNDPKTTIGSMVKEVGQRDRDTSIERNSQVGKKLR